MDWRSVHYDVIVIGSGAAGGIAARVLTDGGANVLLLEAGPELSPEECRPRRRSREEFESIRARQPVQSRNLWYTRENCHLFVDDLQNPYVTDASTSFNWIRSRQAGGRTLVWSRFAPRMSDEEFKAADQDGVGIPWPISLSELAPYYDLAERLSAVGCQVSRNVDELSHRLAKRHPEWNLTAAPEVVSDDISCETLPPYSSVGSTLLRCDPGKLTFRAGFTAAEITLDRPDHARGVRCVESGTGKWYEVSGRVILSCASTIESIRLLLASDGQDYRNGLGNSSGTLGHYLLDHFGGPRMVAVGSITGVRAHSTERLYVPRFCNRGQQTEKFLRGYGIQGELEVRPSGYAVLSVGVYGEVLPNVGNRVKLQAEIKDAAGLRVPNIRYLYGSNERSMAEHAALALRELASAIDFRPLIVHEGILTGGTRAHELGGARMGASPENSVLNPFNQSWDVPNLFITDGSCFPSSGYRAPTLTIMALTARAAEHILRLLHSNP